MNKNRDKYIRLGFFIIFGLALLGFVLYFLGSRKNLFTSTTNIYAKFKSVDGLREGNTVRFAGIDVGLVRSIDIISDSTVQVSLVINNKANQFIKKDSKVTIGSEGLIGSKLVNISSGTTEAASISNGDILPVAEPVTVDEVISMILQTGENARGITRDLGEVTSMIRNGQGLLGSLVADQRLSNEVVGIIDQLNTSSNNFKFFTDEFMDLASDLKRGEGTIGHLLRKDDIAVKINGLLDSMQEASSHAIAGSRLIAEYTEKLNKEDGLLGQLASDTALTEDISELLYNFNEAAKGINTATEKINNSWFFNLFGGRSNGDTNVGRK